MQCVIIDGRCLAPLQWRFLAGLVPHTHTDSYVHEGSGCSPSSVTGLCRSGFLAPVAVASHVALWPILPPAMLPP
eukprot:scaffold335426_cov17-Prasinocladus_malaysianus.AAC.2